MAAAYAFHICENHALVDGNKRVALASALVFLDINDSDFECSEDEIYQVMMDVASGNMKKDELVDIFMQYSKKRK